MAWYLDSIVGMIFISDALAFYAIPLSIALNPIGYLSPILGVLRQHTFSFTCIVIYAFSCRGNDLIPPFHTTIYS